MKRLLISAIVAIIFSVGCTSCDPNSKPCDNVDCGEHASCDPDTGLCLCDDGYEGDECAPNLCVLNDVDCGDNGDCDPTSGECQCDTHWYGSDCGCYFDPADYMAAQVFCPSDSGRLEISGISGEYAGYNGYYLDVSADTVGECSWFFMTAALGVNLPDPQREGQILTQAHGVELMVISEDEPFLEGCAFNEVALLKEIELLFRDHRGTVLFYNEGNDAFEDVSFTIMAEGSVAQTDHFSPFYLLDSDPIVSASAPAVVLTQEVILDFTGTIDEDSGEPFFLSFTASEDGTPLSLTLLDGETHKFSLTLAGGSHTLIAMVEDPYGNVDSVNVDVDVDLCSGVSCEPWETCREVDGICVGDDPCDPNPCLHGGSCANGTGSAVCICTTNWTGADCGTCPADTHYVDGDDCLVNHCYGETCDDGDPCNGVETCDPATGCVDGTPVNCPDDGNLCNGDEACDPADGQCKSFDPVNCPDDGNVCNGNEACDPADGQCKSFDPLVCDDGLACNGVETCVPATGCTNPPDQTCNGHGTCQEPDATCSCSGNWDPATDCGTCLIGWDIATDCTTCASGYGGANCDPKPTISDLDIDCSADGGWCYSSPSGLKTYPVSFNSTNATSWSATVEKTSGGAGTAGTLNPTSGTITGNPTVFDYTTGNTAMTDIRITVTVTGPGGSAVATKDFTIW